MAYEIHSDHIHAVREHLDYREKNGYSTHTVSLFDPNDRSVVIATDALVYIATTDNEAYLGYSRPVDIAWHVLGAHGPSGPNWEYVLELGRALRSLFPQYRDRHLCALEGEICKLLLVLEKEDHDGIITISRVVEHVRNFVLTTIVKII